MSRYSHSSGPWEHEPRVAEKSTTERAIGAAKVFIVTLTIMLAIYGATMIPKAARNAAADVDQFNLIQSGY